MTMLMNCEGPICREFGAFAICGVRQQITLGKCSARHTVACRSPQSRIRVLQCLCFTHIGNNSTLAACVCGCIIGLPIIYVTTRRSGFLLVTTETVFALINLTIKKGQSLDRD